MHHSGSCQSKMTFFPLSPSVTNQNASVSEEDFHNEDSNVNNDTVHYDDEDEDVVFDSEPVSQSNRKSRPQKVTPCSSSLPSCWNVAVLLHCLSLFSCRD